jgi:hypothetical protein
MLKYWTLVLIGMALAKESFHAIDFQLCEDKETAIKPLNVSVSPFPPRRGSKLTMALEATSSEQLNAGDFELTVSVFGIQVVNQHGKLCDFFTCPAGPGRIGSNYSLDIPAIAPPATYSTQVLLTRLDSSTLLCLALNFDIGL